MKNLHIITVATESKYYFPYLVDSIKKHNNKLTTLGFNQTWKGFNWRCNLMKKLLLSYNKTDIICFIDGYDVLCVRDLNDLNLEFIKIKNREKCKIIVGYDYIPNKIIKFKRMCY